jgi:hypothetical protein
MTEEREQIVEFRGSERSASFESRIQTLQYRLNGTGWSDEIAIEMLLRG